MLTVHLQVARIALSHIEFAPVHTLLAGPLNRDLLGAQERRRKLLLLARVPIRSIYLAQTRQWPKRLWQSLLKGPPKQAGDTPSACPILRPV